MDVSFGIVLVLGLLIVLGIGAVVVWLTARKQGNKEVVALSDSGDNERSAAPPALPSSLNEVLPLVVVGIVGKSHSGQAALMESLFPSGIEGAAAGGRYGVWTQRQLSLPLVSISRIVSDTHGEEAQDRRLYQIHNELVDLLGGSLSYQEFVDLVQDIEFHGLAADPTTAERRDFLQWLGARLRYVDPDCLIKRLRAATIKDHMAYGSDSVDAHVVVVPDIRLRREAEFIYGSTNSLLVRLSADDDRCVKTKEEKLTNQQKQDVTELEPESIPIEWIDLDLRVLDCDVAEARGKLVESVNRTITN